MVYADRAIADVPHLTLQPRGMTALYDAVGKLITDIGAELAAQPDSNRPGAVVIVVLTDGHENSSVEWSHEAVHSAIGRRETVYSWDFVFLGANMDAVETGRKLGFRADRSITYEASEAGVESVFASTAAYVSRVNAAPAGYKVAGFSDEDRRSAVGGKD